MKQRPGFMLYFELVDPLCTMGDAEAGKLFKALMAYAQCGEVRELQGVGDFAFRLMRERIDRDAEAYAERCRKNAYYSYLNSAKRRGELPMEYEEGCGRESAGRDPTQPNRTQRSSNDNSNHNFNSAAAENSTGPAGAALPPVDQGAFSFSPAVRQRVEEWLRYKAERREPYTPTGFQSLLGQLHRSIERHGEAAVTELICACMAAGYRGIVFDRLESRGGGGQAPGTEEGDLTWMKPYIEKRDRERKQPAVPERSVP